MEKEKEKEVSPSEEAPSENTIVADEYIQEVNEYSLAMTGLPST